MPGLDMTIRNFWDDFFVCALRHPADLFTTYRFPDNPSDNDAKIEWQHLREYLLRLEYQLLLNNAKDIFAESELIDPEGDPEIVQPEEEPESS